MRQAKWLAALVAVAGGTSASAETFGYDGMGRLSTVLHEDGKTTTYTYDLAGNRTSVTVTAAAGLSAGASISADGEDGLTEEAPPPSTESNDGAFPSLEDPTGE